MPKLKKVCRVCGKTYESCRTIKTGSGIFNWREMCCSPECGQAYFQRVEEARNPVPKQVEKKVHTRRLPAIKKAPTVSESVPMNEAEDRPVETDAEE